MLALIKRRPRAILVIAAASVAVIFLIALAAPILLRPSYPTPMTLSEQARADAALTGGARAYAVHCAACHDTGIAPSLNGRALDPETVRFFTRQGRGAMPAFTPVEISDADIDAVAAFLNELPAEESE